MSASIRARLREAYEQRDAAVARVRSLEAEVARLRAVDLDLRRLLSDVVPIILAAEGEPQPPHLRADLDDPATWTSPDLRRWVGVDADVPTVVRAAVAARDARVAREDRFRVLLAESAEALEDRLDGVDREAGDCLDEALIDAIHAAIAAPTKGTP